MDDGELTVDFGIKDANLTNFDEMPHKINKKAFILKVQKHEMVPPYSKADLISIYSN